MDYNNVKSKLDGVGCGFCLAKWSQVTIHLDKGLTHSCHHPSPHKIPLRELKNNPSALHNTRFKKKKRRERKEKEKKEKETRKRNEEKKKGKGKERRKKEKRERGGKRKEKGRREGWRRQRREKERKKEE